MKTRAEERPLRALALFGIDGGAAQISLIRHNENEIYSVAAGSSHYALRIHESAPGFVPMEFTPTPQAEKRRAECELLRLLSSLGAAVQTPVAGINGEYVQQLDLSPVTLLTWLEGDGYDALWPDAAIPDAPAFEAGYAAGRLDALMRDKACAFSAGRPHYGSGMLEAVKRRLICANEAGAILPAQLESILAALDIMAIDMDEAERASGITLCHADLSGGNIVRLASGKAGLIDFSLCGTASPYMDIAGLYASFTREGVRRAMRAGFEQGLGQHMEIRLVQAYFALSVMLFIAMRYTNAPTWDWFPAAMERWTRDIFAPLAQGRAFLCD